MRIKENGEDKATKQAKRRINKTTLPEHVVASAFYPITPNFSYHATTAIRSQISDVANILPIQDQTGSNRISLRQSWEEV